MGRGTATLGKPNITGNRYYRVFFESDATPPEEMYATIEAKDELDAYRKLIGVRVKKITPST
jgi:hypothetical protein